MAKTVILGAGLTGLSTAYHFERSGFFDYEIFEKEATVGGLCGSVHDNGFTFDYTGHLIHGQDPYFLKFLSATIGLEHFNLITRKSYVYSSGIYTPYPFQMHLHGLPPRIITECIAGFVKRKQSIKQPSNFHDWVLKYFGRGIGKHFLFPFNKKLWCSTLQRLHPSWTNRFVPKTSLEKIIHGAAAPKTHDGIGYNSLFYYPKSSGIGFLPNALAQKIQKPMHTKAAVCAIDLKSKHIHFSDGRTEHYEKLITTLPLDVLLSLIVEPSNNNLKKALHNLRCTALVNFNLGVRIPCLTDKHWIYFPEKQFSFYRIGFWHNFSSAMAPPGCSSFYGEYTYLPDRKTKRQIKKMTQRSIEHACKLFNIDHGRIITQKILPINHAYVIYDAWRQKNLNKLLAALQENGVYSIGRFGAWKYSSMQEAILDGRDIANALLKETGVRIQGAAKTIFDSPCISNRKKPSTMNIEKPPENPDKPIEKHEV